MSRSRLPPLPSRWGHATISALAEALGVHRNSVSAWLSLGAPAGPPFDEYLWRVWAAGQLKACPKDPEPELLQMLVVLGLPDYVQRSASARADLAAFPGVQGGTGVSTPAGTPIEQVAATFKEREAKANAESAEAKAVQDQLDLAERQRRVITVEALEPLVVAICRLFGPVMRTVPDRCAEAVSDPVDQAAVRAAATAAIATGQGELIGKTLDHLKTFLEELSST